MNYFDAIILGLVQGLTEFIPVSSSGHLVIINTLLGTEQSFVFGVLLNIGTLAALVVYYRKRIMEIIQKTITGKEWKLLAKLVAAIIPAFAFGLLFGDYIKNTSATLWIVVVMLFVVGVLFIIYGSPNKDADDKPLEESITWQVALTVGFVQVLALIPGTSRSGITILAGLKSNLSAARAAEFSFMLAIPTIAGATVKVLLLDGGISYVNENLGIIIVGNLVSFTSGIVAVSFLIRWLSKRGLKDFGWYRIVLAIVLSVLLITGTI